MSTKPDETDRSHPADPTPELEAQRREAQRDRDAGASDDRPDDGIAPLVNNTGDDGGAASG